ncbi:hypothetical protein BIV23_01600 [Streptomyces monashensis]|uniref:CHAT domain-containing protein n=1 Tax=Streptomyces monashensis TaxID=1678012 RepID=A0A1S2QNM7_9ACTN|nr:hypothetical protein BIV23_01600 [Streptomyces monashensis]
MVARLVAAQNARDPAPLRDQDAVADALSLLREAAPAPGAPVDLGALADVFWTFWFRHQGAEDPDAEQNLTLVFGTFGHLCPRVPDGIRLPEALTEGFDAADPSHEARFAHLMSTAYLNAAAEGPTRARTAALESARAWSDTSFEYVQAEDHVGFVLLAVHAHDVHITRFQTAADPDGLAAAARYGQAVCTRLAAAEPGLFDADGARAVAAATLRTVVDAARLLGTPRLALVERLVAAAPDGAVTPETADGLRFLRMLDAQPVGWPGERDLVVGATIADAGIAEHDAGRIACAVRRLRTALAATPAGHPAHPRATTALGQALAALGAEREDEEAVAEALELLDSVGALSDEQRDMLSAYRELQEAGRSEDPDGLKRVGPLLGRLVERVREDAAQAGGGALDIDLELVGLAAGFEPDDTSDERIDRYRTAVAALPADRPHRHAYVAVLAALTGLRAEALRDTAPARAGLLAAECRELTEEVVAGAPAGSPVSDLLRRGQFAVALPVAIVSAGTGDVLDDDMRGRVEQLTRMSEIRLSGRESLDADIEIIRELMADMGEDGSTVRPYLSAALGAALSSRSATRPDLTELEEVVSLLRDARANAPDLPGEFNRILANALTTVSLGRFDAEGAREAAALLASAQGLPGMPADEGEPRPGDPVLSDTDKELLACRTQLHNALQNYLFGHEPAQLDRARQIARRMRDITRAVPAVPAGDDPPWYDLMGDVYVDLVETVGPGGGPRRDLSDAVVDQCRATFARCAPGHPLRTMTAMTLVRALAQRAIALRATEPGRAQALLTEAEELSHVLTDEMPQGAPVDAGAAMRTVLDVIRRGRLPKATTSTPTSASTSTATGAPRTGTPEDFLSALMKPLQDRLSGVVDPEAWQDTAIPVWMRAHGEIGAAAGALGRDQPRVDLALAHLEAGIEAMAAVTDRGSDQASAEHGLSTFEGDIRSITELVLAHLVGQALVERLPAQVKALEESVRAVKAGRTPHVPAPLERRAEGPDVDRAAELLERGRGLLLARRIEARADTGGLRSAHPELAAEFERLTEQLDARPEPGAAGDAEWARLAGLRASRELDGLVRHIRTQPGFEGFLRPLAAEELRALAADGPVVLLNHARRYCHALVVTPGSITALHLEAEADEITAAARTLRDAVDAINAQGTSRPSPLQLVAAGDAVRETLAWTWHTIVRPVLKLVGSAAPVPDHADWPRIWWVPTGPFSALPLHAAQCTAPDCEREGCGAALDAVVSSYVPGLQTLAYARARARQRGTADHGSALLVAAPEDDLPGVAAATAHAAELLGSNPPLTGPAATREAVLAALHDASWAHFGCHAATDPTEPSGALLHLPSGEPVSVLDICRARPRAAQLAFLAACGTARTAERLTDEAIHITSSFLLAGFPAAVGTLWKIDSTHADRMTRDFYRRTTAPDTPGPARALHDTVRHLRHRIPDRPHIWAAYVHAGT